MAFGSFEARRSSAPMAEINMIPLIDVMLVLLVIFIITAPLLTHAVKIDLPKAASHANLTKPDHIALSIDGAANLLERRAHRPHATCAAHEQRRRSRTAARTAPARRPDDAIPGARRSAGRGRQRLCAYRLCFRSEHRPLIRNHNMFTRHPAPRQVAASPYNDYRRHGEFDGAHLLPAFAARCRTGKDSARCTVCPTTAQGHAATPGDAVARGRDAGGCKLRAIACSRAGKG